MPPALKDAGQTYVSQIALDRPRRGGRTDQSEEDILPQTRSIRERPVPAENGPVARNSSTEAETQGTSPVPHATPLIRLRTSDIPHRRFEVLQQFEGVVLSVREDEFEAELSDMTDPTKAVEFVDLPLSDISPADRPLLGAGCIFYWILGYEYRKGGQVTRVSEIRLRRSPPWSRRTLDEVRAKARETFGLFNTDGKKTPLQD
jgi:hypothetical protein